MKELRRSTDDIVGTHVILPLGYEIQNRKFNMSRKHVYIFLHT